MEKRGKSTYPLVSVAFVILKKTLIVLVHKPLEDDNKMKTMINK